MNNDQERTGWDLPSGQHITWVMNEHGHIDYEKTMAGAGFYRLIEMGEIDGEADLSLWATMDGDGRCIVDIGQERTEWVEFDTLREGLDAIARWAPIFSAAYLADIWGQLADLERALEIVIAQDWNQP